MGKYYDGTKLLSMKDINGNTPEIYMCTTNRTGGKTTYFGRLCVNRFLKHKEKFKELSEENLKQREDWTWEKKCYQFRDFFKKNLE